MEKNGVVHGKARTHIFFNAHMILLLMSLLNGHQCRGNVILHVYSN